MSDTTSNDDVLVKVEGVSKKFCRSLKRSLWYGVQDVGNELLGRKGGHDELRKNEFWAVNDVSFELKRGECLGLIGPNGAGKSTLLKMLNGLVKPDKGRITMRGRVGALIELGAGFNPILTARENIYVNGSVLGFSKAEIDKKFDAIVAFSQIEEFIDTPVQSFSTGMKVRLGFSVAAQMEPDVLIIDEVLSVGDVGFRTKCVNAIFELMENSAVVFVSHNMTDIARISTKILCLDNGSKGYEGLDVHQGIKHYYFNTPHIGQNLISGNNKAKIEKFEIRNCADEATNFTKYLDELKFFIVLALNAEVEGVVVNITFIDEKLIPVAAVSSKVDCVTIKNECSPLKILAQLDKVMLNDGTYQIEISVHDQKMKNVLTKHSRISYLQVESDGMAHTSIKLPARWTAI